MMRLNLTDLNHELSFPTSLLLTNSEFSKCFCGFLFSYRQNFTFLQKKKKNIEVNDEGQINVSDAENRGQRAITRNKHTSML